MQNSSTQPIEFVTRKLFDGAITMDVPKMWLDTSDLRPVPDNQEVFQSNNADYPILLSLELLEQQTHVSDDKAADYFYRDLSNYVGFESSNDVQFFDFFPTTPLDQMDRSALMQLGEDIVHMSGGLGLHKNVQISQKGPGSVETSPTPMSVRIDLAVFRLFQQETDMLLALQTPLNNPDPLLPQAMDPVLKRAVETLTIQNWGLFG
ncbi:Ran-interacting Mog1 domain containing protein [Nitzschia inconspicua]|uniref:Ran-interacting Mog1 domain containing protein n=1 Tax=Nitzschia inconspicua TaxID=303405 RepID=A0A9K3P8Y5_9STRA|nr:Ran-interacting Mog1 domain containing protein [Nitzschia inconspicua]KAG7344437.1 Ran-interacting Mog1 domain containing protein [Nitzschia inconspicua]